MISDTFNAIMTNLKRDSHDPKRYENLSVTLVMEISVIRKQCIFNTNTAVEGYRKKQ